MRRRELMLVLPAIVASPRALRAQPKPMPVIGYLSSARPNPGTLAAFHDGLAETGYSEGKNVRIEYRWAEGRYERLSDLAADLVRRRVDVIVATGGGVSGRVAKATTSTIPIVMLGGGDFVAAGLAGSLSHPGGNVTGLAQLLVELRQSACSCCTSWCLLPERSPISRTRRCRTRTSRPEALNPLRVPSA